MDSLLGDEGYCESWEWQRPPLASPTSYFCSFSILGHRLSTEVNISSQRAR
jgi:hypothetical protein